MHAVEVEHPKPWLQAAIDQRLAFVMEHTGGVQRFKAEGIEVGMVFLTEPHEGASQAEFARWNQSCDNCGKVVTRMLNGHVTREKGGITFIITVGACEDCGLEDLT